MATDVKKDFLEFHGLPMEVILSIIDRSQFLASAWADRAMPQSLSGKREHGIRLQTVSGHRSKAADFSAQVRTAIGDLEKLAGTPTPDTPIGLQDYVINRLRGGLPRGSWLDKFPLQAAAHFAHCLARCPEMGANRTSKTSTTMTGLRLLASATK